MLFALWPIATLRGATFRIQPMLLVVWIALSWALAGGSTRAGIGGGVAALGLVWLVHGLGHLTAALLGGFSVSSIHIDVMGVAVDWKGRGSRWSHAAVAFGGVTAHMLLALFTLSLPATDGFVTTLTTANLLLLAANLLPAGTFDGNKGWMHVRRGWGLITEAPRAAPPRPVAQPPAPPPPPIDLPPEEVPPEVKQAVDNLFSELRAESKARRKVPPPTESSS